MDGNGYKDGKTFLFPVVSVVHLYSLCFTTLTLIAVVCKRVCVFHSTATILHINGSVFLQPKISICWSNEQSQGTKPVSHCCTVHLQLFTETQGGLQCFQTHPVHASEMPALQLSCTGLNSHPSPSLVLLGAVSHLHYTLL